MRRKVQNRAGGVALGLIALVACSEPATSPEVLQPVVPLLGNGFPDNGKATLYKMNLIGHPGEIPSDNTGGEGKRILVRLWRNTRILLSPGTEFDILDANGTDGVASFQLPDPDPDNDGETWYGVYIRPKGTPKGKATLSSCKIVDAEEVCSTESYVLVRGTGKPQVENVSKELLTVCLDLDQIVEENPCDVREFLFDDALAEYLWNVDNQGLRNAEVRFIEIPQGPFTQPQ